MAIGFFIGAALLAVGGMVELLNGVKQRQEPRGIALPMAAEEPARV